MKAACFNDDPTIRFVDEPEALRKMYEAWHIEFGERELRVLDILPETETGELLLMGRPWSSIRLEWRLHWLNNLVAGDFKLVRASSGKWKVVRQVD
jgi:hypothetical protein